MKPSEKLAADGIDVDPDVAEVLDRGWEDYDPAEDEEVFDFYEDFYETGDAEPRPWDVILWTGERAGRTVASMDDLMQWLDENEMTVEEFKQTGLYWNRNRPGFEWLKELEDA